MRTALTQARATRRMTQAQVARAVGISVRNYQNIEAGTTKPNVETAISIAQRQLREDCGNDTTIVWRDRT